MQEPPDNRTHATWEEFLESHADVIFRVVRLFVESYDDRMDLFLFVCDRLKADDMRRVRSYRFKPETPCKFSTYLAVVTKNLALDFLRARDGRQRPFRSLSGSDSADRLLFEYYLRDGRPIEETRSLMRERHGLRMSAAEASRRAERLEASLTTSQRWRLISRLQSRRRPLSIDPVEEVVRGGSGDRTATPLLAPDGDPEEALSSDEAERVLGHALLSLPPRQRLALVLKYRDGLPARDVGKVIDTSAPEADRLAREGLETVRCALRESRVTRPDIESSSLPSILAGPGGVGA